MPGIHQWRNVRVWQWVYQSEAHTERLYNLLLTNPELAAMIEAEVMKATYHSMRDDGDEHTAAEPT